MQCTNCGSSNQDNAKFCIQCGSELKNNETPNPESRPPAVPKEYLFKWVKQFSYLTLKTVETKAVLKESSLNLQSQTFHLGIFKGKPKTINLSLSDIQQVQIKRLINYFDIAFAIMFIIAGFINLLFFLVAAVFLWTGINTSIVIFTKSHGTTKIPSGDKSAANEFVNAINAANSTNINLNI